jgi:hypothetical protein
MEVSTVIQENDSMVLGVKTSGWGKEKYAKKITKRAGESCNRSAPAWCCLPFEQGKSFYEMRTRSEYHGGEKEMRVL